MSERSPSKPSSGVNALCNKNPRKKFHLGVLCSHRRGDDTKDKCFW